MGVFKVPIQVGDPSAQTFESIEATVDTGATNTMLPANLLNKLGVMPYKSPSSNSGTIAGSNLMWVGRG